MTHTGQMIYPQPAKNCVLIDLVCQSSLWNYKLTSSRTLKSLLYFSGEVCISIYNKNAAKRYVKYVSHSVGGL